MTRNQPTLRRTSSTADLYSDPPPLPRPTGLSRASTTAQRSRPNPFTSGARGYQQQLLARHSIAQFPNFMDKLDLDRAYYDVPDDREPERLPQYPNFMDRLDREGQFSENQKREKLRVAQIPNFVENLDRDRPYNGISGNQKPGKSRTDQIPNLMDKLDLDRPYNGSSGNQKPEKSPLPPPIPPKIKLPMAPKFRPQTNRKSDDPAEYAKPFCDFLTDNPTVFHAVDAVAKDLEKAGYSKLSERDSWKLKTGGKYYVERNGSSLIAFAIGDGYEPGNGAAILAGHIDALTARLKPIPKLRTKAGYVQLGVAPYAGALNSTWWDRDLGIGGRVLVKEGNKIVSKLVKLDWPIARIPTLAPHFGAAAAGPFNKETQMVPIVGLDNSDLSGADDENWKPSLLGGEGTFASTQPEGLVKAITNELNITDYSSIVNWELELFDIQPAQLGGLNKEFIFGGRIDDKLCSWSAVQALINSTSSSALSNSSQIKIVGLFDDEEIGSLLRQGARSNFLPTIIERVVDSFADKGVTSLLSRTYANSFLVSSDVTHAVNPNFLGSYLENHSPRLNVGLSVTCDPNGHMTTDSVSASILQRCAEKGGAKLQVFQIRNDSRSGGTVGPMLSAMTGIRAIDAGIPQLSMHSIRATTGALDPGLGVVAFSAFLDHFESVDVEFQGL